MPPMSGAGAGRLPPDVWASMSAADRQAHIKRNKRAGRVGERHRLPAEVWASMSPEDRQAHIRRSRRRQSTNKSSPDSSRGSAQHAGAAGSGSIVDGGGRLAPEVWAAMTAEERTAHRKQRTRAAQRRRRRHPPKKPQPRAYDCPSPGGGQELAKRFAQYDRVWCNLGDD
eukprot:COSAG01_NODE_23913_length_797_cov_1.356734_1_plen_169_part_10